MCSWTEICDFQSSFMCWIQIWPLFFSQHVRFLRFFELPFFWKITNCMIKGCKQFFKQKAIHDFDAFFNKESIDCFVFSISYTVPKIIGKNYWKTRKKMVLQITLYLTEYHLFFSQLHVILSFFDAEKNYKKFIVPAATVRKIRCREVVSFYRVASSTAYKYLRRIYYYFALNTSCTALALTTTQDR